jgi:hypothetical protein
MKFPYVVLPELTEQQLHRFEHHVDSDASGWHRKWTESIWRRHQHPSNAKLSGWASSEDSKRRLIHFYDEYDVTDGAFVLKNAYLWVNWTLPEPHIQEYRAAIANRLERGGWTEVERTAGANDDEASFRRGDLRATVKGYQVHPEDQRRNVKQPDDYRNLDLVVKNESYQLPEGWAERPWRVFHEVGLRKVLPRGKPRIVEAEQLVDFLPAQLELGCGPSIEAGIPHLSNLHRIYGVSLPNYGFIYRAAQDGVLELLSSPETKYREMTDIYRACLVAGSTDFYRAIGTLRERGQLVGPVITNNFDCQCADLGFPEISLRNYDWEPYYPQIPYDPRAKSLLVVGVHADRRLVQMRAREQGLQVIFVDPEEYVAPDGSRIHYPVEAPQDEDLFVRSTASDALTRLLGRLTH